jgi:hypothetical protein
MELAMGRKRVWLPREVTSGLTNAAGDAVERMVLIESTTESAVVRTAVNLFLLQKGYLTVEQLTADANRGES